MSAPEALWWPQNLEYFSYNDKLDCYIDYAAPDKSTGYNGAAYLIHAFAGGVDIIDYLAPHVIKTIESEALWCYSN